jgi:2-dehydro-3-deoxyphosphogluconate aldolase / (4S)-4-hydroxy-2-oxoglutarate aldolase
VKVYPSNAMGGPSYIKALLTPMPDALLIPSGGVNVQTAAQFIAEGAAAVEVGSDLVDMDALNGGRIQDIHINAHLYLDVIDQARAFRPGAQT